MKTESQIQRRLRQRHFRVQKRVLEGSLRRFHRNCAHNVEAVTAYEGIACVCTHPDLAQSGSYDVEVGRLKLANAVPRLPACDEDTDRSPTCPHFEPRHSKELLQERYKQLMAEVTTDPEKFAEGFPDMAQLAWVLELTGNGDSHTDLLPGAEGDEEDEDEPEPDDRVIDGPAVQGENPAAHSAKSAASEDEVEETPVPDPEPEPDPEPVTAAPEGVVTLTKAEPVAVREWDLKSTWWRRLIGWILERWG